MDETGHGWAQTPRYYTQHLFTAASRIQLKKNIVKANHVFDGL